MNTGLIKNVYLADDDEDDRFIFTEILQQVDPSVNLWQFESGEKLTQILCETLEPMPDVLFLNINMPIKNGFECLQEIRSRSDNLKNITIIMYSTSRNPDTIARALELGADWYLIKPASVSVLSSLIKKVLEINTAEPAPGFVLQ